MFHRGAFYRLEIERFRSRWFLAEEFKAHAPRLDSEPHYHIALYTDGDGSWMDMDGVHRAEERELLLLPPFHPHMILACRPETYRIMILTFLYRHGDDYFQQPFKNLLAQYVDGVVPETPTSLSLSLPLARTMEERLETLLDAVLSHSPYRHVDVNDSFNNVITFLHRILVEKSGDQLGEDVAFRLDKIKNHLDRFPENDLSLEDLGRMASMSKEHLVRSFKRRFGLPPVQYRRSRRMDKAVSLLLNTNLAINAIAEATGFGDIYHFSKTFKDAFSVSPRNYRGRTIQD